MPTAEAKFHTCIYPDTSSPLRFPLAQMSLRVPYPDASTLETGRQLLLALARVVTEARLSPVASVGILLEHAAMLAIEAVLVAVFMGSGAHRGRTSACRPHPARTNSSPSAFCPPVGPPLGASGHPSI